jgi:hypothetical protein
MKKISVVLLFVASMSFAQGSPGFIAKFNSSTTINNSLIFQNSSGNIGVATGAPTDRLQVNSGDFLVKGPQNFFSAGHVAHAFVGDHAHFVGATWGKGMFFGTYKAPSAMFLQDKTGYIGIGTNTPTAWLHVVEGTFPANNGVPMLVVESPSTEAGMTLDAFGHMTLSSCGGSGCSSSVSATEIRGNNLSSSGDVFIGDGSCGRFGCGALHLQSPGFGIVFPDGTVQTTAYRPATASAMQAATAQALNQTKDAQIQQLTRIVQQLQSRVAQLEAMRK